MSIEWIGLAVVFEFFQNKWVTLLVSVLLVTACNSSSETNAGIESESTRLLGNLYYFEGRYGQEKLNAYIQLNLADLSSTILSSDRGWQYTISRNKSKLMIVDPSMTVINVYAYNGVLLSSLSLGKTVIGVPRFSHDGKYIAAIIANDYAHKYLAILTSEGKAVNVVDIYEEDRERDGVQGVDWTPEGQIVYSAYGKIYRLPDITTDQVELIRSFETDLNVYSVRVSPDGKKLAFVANESHVQQPDGNLYTLKMDGTDVKQVTETGVVRTFTYPAWAPDSQHLAAHFAVNAAGAECGVIWVFDTELEQTPYIVDATTASEVMGSYKIDTADYEVHGLCAGEGLDWF